MFNKKKERPKRDHSGKNLSQYGLFDIPADFNTGLGNDSFDDDAGDSDLEAELAALSSDNGPSRPQRKKPAKKIIPQGELDAMVADTVKGADEDDDDISVDEDDPELLGELNEIAGEEEEADVTTAAPAPEPPDSSPVSDTSTVLLERLKSYEQAEKIAKSSGESSKARRYGRAIKTLKDLVKQAQAGKPVNLNDESVPPEIHVGDKKPSRPAPALPDTEPQEDVPTASQESPAEPDPEPVTLPINVQENVAQEKASIDTELLSVLSERQKQYKIAALKAKKEGDADTAIRYVKIAKLFENVIAAVQDGQEVDLSNMPGPPGEPPVEEAKPEQNETQKNPSSEIEVPEEAQDLPEPELITASSVGEALQQRLDVYKQHESQAKEEGNASKARRFGRIVKQYEQAIKQYKAGKPIAVDELPTPPGYGPIPVEGVPAAAPAPKAKPQVPASPSTSSAGDPTTSGEGGASPGQRKSGNHVSTTHAEKQVLILLAKQKQFKQAALNAKKKGEMMEAKEFLRQAKGFDKLIEAARAGLPVDWSSIPVSPEAKSQLDNEYNIAMAEEATEESLADFDVLARLENQLQKQLKMCLSTRDHNRALGDVAGTNRFERLALNVTKDLDVLRMAIKTSGGAVPKFHYETKEFSIVKSFTDIPDNSMEVTIHRGINYQTENPKEIDTYVTIEFPFPQDTPFTGRTATIKDTNNPSYNKTFVIPIQRNSRQCQRVFKRHGIKFEVYSKGGFFRGDSLLGTVKVELQPLETRCEIHDSFDLLEGRKKVGGKLEIQIRLRNPIVTQQVEQIKEKWLVIDQ
ncbi:unnamed protein product [Acanthoscelides obtectus]|uniref:C2 domain-containing protein n=2 Tax=Acanthoscelides obtectus TaxID=200917 RepID=A0A9P0KVM0_ACAOB|nr:unnamed protein product [Acanthoscelides obtectus]CAK1637840.1 Coiled-coil and C2 domain-containing protein 1-like [Acanthoscelides obtectus]